MSGAQTSLPRVQSSAVRDLSPAAEGNRTHLARRPIAPAHPSRPADLPNSQADSPQGNVTANTETTSLEPSRVGKATTPALEVANAVSHVSTGTVHATTEHLSTTGTRATESTTSAVREGVQRVRPVAEVVDSTVDATAVIRKVAPHHPVTATVRKVSGDLVDPVLDSTEGAVPTVVERTLSHVDRTVDSSVEVTSHVVGGAVGHLERGAGSALVPGAVSPGEDSAAQKATAADVTRPLVNSPPARTDDPSAEPLVTSRHAVSAPRPSIRAELVKANSILRHQMIVDSVSSLGTTHAAGGATVAGSKQTQPRTESATVPEPQLPVFGGPCTGTVGVSSCSGSPHPVAARTALDAEQLPAANSRETARASDWHLPTSPSYLPPTSPG